MGLFKRDRRFFKVVSVLAAFSMAYSSSAAGFNSALTSLASTLAVQLGGGGSDYTDSPYTPDTLPNPTTQPDNRGDFYSADDLSQIETAAEIQMGTATQPDASPLSDPVYVDPGDDGALYGRPVPADKSMGDPNSVAGGSLGLDAGSTGGATPPTTTSTNGGTGGTTAGSTGTTGGTTGTTTGGTTGIIGAGGNGAHAGSGFPWEGTRPGGGSEFASGAVNTQTGNRLTTVPIVGWKTRGGVPFGLTLFHNSQDATDVGWGKGWRSNVDFSVTFTGVNSTTNMASAVVAYPDGRRLVFKSKLSGNSLYAPFFPPTGFYDTLVANGVAGQKPRSWSLRTKSQMTYFFTANGVLTSYRDRYGNSVTVTKTTTNITLQDASGNAGNVISVSSVPYTNFEQLGATAGMALRYFNHITAPGNRAWDLNFMNRSNQDIVMTTITYPTLSGSRPVESFYYNNAVSPYSLATIGREHDVQNRDWYQTYSSNGSELTYQLPVNGNTGTDPIYSFTYNGGNTVFTFPSGNTIIEYYNEGVLAQIKDQAPYWTQFTYDKYYNISVIKDNRGSRSYYTWDAFANLMTSQTQRQYSANVAVSHTYNSYNDVMTDTDCRGVVTHYNRTSYPGTLTSITDGNGHTLFTNTYNSDGTLATTSAEGVTTQIGYDSNYLPNYVSTPDGSATIVYGSGTLVGKPISVTDNRNRTSSLGYDDWGRLTSMTRFDSAIASVALNTMGYVNTSTDVLQHQATFTRDGIGRIKSVLNARGDTEGYTYTTDGALFSVTNGNQNTRTYAYSKRGELTHIYFADGTTEQYLYDGNGNQTQRINGLYQTIQYAYDTEDNLSTVTYPSGTPTSFTYDNDGRQLTMNDSTGQSSWQYDNGENITQLTTPQGVMGYAYDQWNRRTTLTEGTVSTIYGYVGNKLSTITKSADSVNTSLNYDQYGRLNQKNDGATTTTYGFDGNDRVNSIVHTRNSDNSVLEQETYNYDYADNLTSKVVNSVSTIYAYDAIDQLLSESNSSFTNTYTYDHNGNRLTKTANGVLETYSYDAADKLQSRTGANGNYSYTYDNAGRTSTISGPNGTRIFTWDYEDRLTNLSGGGVPSTNYGYNGVRARVSKSNSIGSRTYKRDGVEVSAPVLSDGTATMVPGISERVNGVTSIIHTDQMGSMKGLSSSGTVTDTADYDAFGRVIARTGSAGTQKGYAAGFGYQEDSESAYKLLGSRFYDPDSGRFLSRDSSRDGRNWYSYVNNNPLKAIDAEGLKPHKVVKGDKYYDDISNAIDSISALDPEMGKYLRKLLREGKIYVDEDKEGFGETDPKTGIITLDNLAYKGYQKASSDSRRAHLAAILLHEGYHSKHHKAECYSNEIEACAYTEKILLLWLQRKNLSNDLRSEIANMLQQSYNYESYNKEKVLDEIKKQLSSPVRRGGMHAGS